jgi:predicted neuraminidase
MRPVVVLALLLTASVTVRAGDIELRQVFGPETPGRYKHPAAITELADGTLYLAYYAGSGEYATDTAVYGSRLEKATGRWTAPAVVADTPFVSEGNPVVWQAPDGIVWLFYVVRYGETWSTSRIQAKISRDGAHSWSDPILLTFEQGMMVRGRPIVLANGDYLLPIYHETGNDTEFVGADSTSLFLRYGVRTRKWSETGRIRSKNGNIQPAVELLGNDHLVAYCRRGGGYGAGTKGFIIRSESRDGGQTWSEGRDTQFPNPNAAVDFLRLRNGHLLLAYNDSMTGRDPLTVAVSTDNDRTYSHRRNIAQGGTRDFAYPYLIQTRDDKIHLIFTSHRRTVINHAVFEESAIMQGTRAVQAQGPPSSRDSAIRHVKVFGEPGRFGGWPANHGIWSWGNEILVGFSAGYYKNLGPERHAIDRERPEEHLLARSRDGGETWAIENPAAKGALIPVGAALHGVTPDGAKERPWTDSPGGIDFTHPDFALTVRMTDVNKGPARFYYSTDRGHNWQGPFRLPLFGQAGIAARTDYIVGGKDDCMLFLTASKSNGREGRPLCVRTRDGGKTWQFVGWIAPEPAGYSIMPATVRLGLNELLTAIRRREDPRKWIETYRSRDDGVTWQLDTVPVPDNGEGNPASLIRLSDGRLCLTYGVRAKPFRICARLSSDGGRIWSEELVLRDDGAGRDIGYPRTVQRPDGKVVTVYYFWDERSGPERYIGATIWEPPAR